MLSCRVLPARGGGVDDVVGAGCECSVTLLRCAGCADDLAGTESLCDLDGGGADAAAGSADEDGFAFGEVGLMGEGEHRGGAGDNDACGFVG